MEEEGIKDTEGSRGKNTQQSLKAKSRFVKRSQPSKFKTKKNKGAWRIWAKQHQRKNMTIVGEKSGLNEEEYVEKQISEDSQQNRTTDEQPKEKSQQVKSTNEDSQNKSNSDKLLSKKSHHTENNQGKVIELDKSKQKQKKRVKRGESNKGVNSRKNKSKHGRMGKIHSNEQKKEKLGGLIFMCSEKTKPDCFCYRVMGVSAGKKDVVLGVKAGLKLFLYDFNLKLLYGIYKASSSGGMKLEPRAFNGSFPAQVRFSIDKDCFPLPESIFRKAIIENYNEKNKFKTELTVRQVRKLTKLFRPAELHSTLQPDCSPPKVIMLDREVSDGVWGQWSHLHRERSHQDHYANGNEKSHHVLADEWDHQYERREEYPPDLFLTEKDHRVYGLQGDRRNLTPPSHMNPMLEPYKRDYEREHLHQTSPIYRDPADANRLHTDPLYLNESEYQAYGHDVGHDYARDPYHAHRYGASSRDPYLRPSHREEFSSSAYLVRGRTLSGADNLHRRETVKDRLYSTYAADAFPDYNPMQHYHRARPESPAMPVSSHYAFAGPSFAYC